MLLLLRAAADGRSFLGLGDRAERLTGAVANRVVELLDVDGVIARIDVDRLLARMDINALLARVDPNALLARVDPNALLARLDVDALLARLDLNALLAQVDVNGLLGRVDPDLLLARLDMDALLARVDLDLLLGKIDANALVARIDVDDLVQRARIPQILAESSGRLAGSAVDVARRQLAGLDALVAWIAFRAIGRDPDALPAGPAPFVAERPPLVTGRYAGAVSRLAAYALDGLFVVAGFTLLAVTTAFLLRIVTGVELDTADRSGPVWAGLLAAWAFLYGWVSVAATGRTPGMAVAGLRVVTGGGNPLPVGRALVRILVLPLSTAAFGLGFLGVLIDRRRRALHDLAAGSVVIYDWGDAPGALSSPLTAWLSRRDPARAVLDAGPGRGPPA